MNSDSSDLKVDGSSVTFGDLKLHGGFDNNPFIGGAGNDTIRGDLGADILSGGAGSDKFIYRSLFDSTEKFGNDNADVIRDFEKGDSIVLPNKYNTVFHIGITEAHRGDIDVSYDAQTNLTRLGIYVDSDRSEDMVIYLNGHISNLVVADQSHIVFG